MIKIMFVCYGNICRSPMAEFLMKELVKGREDEFIIESSATSYEEIGNPVHYGTVRILNKLNIDCSKKRARKLVCSDYDNYDYFIGMDKQNLRDMLKIFGGDKDNKVKLLLDFTPLKRDVLDPYWTGDFESTFQDIRLGTSELFKFLGKK